MPASSAAPNAYQLNGLVERVTFFSEESGFRVLRVKAEGHRDLITVVGSVPQRFGGEVDYSRRRLGHRQGTATELLDVDSSVVEQALSWMLIKGELVFEPIEDKDLIFLPYLVRAETEIARRVTTP